MISFCRQCDVKVHALVSADGSTSPKPSERLKQRV